MHENHPGSRTVAKTVSHLMVLMIGADAESSRFFPPGLLGGAWLFPAAAPWYGDRDGVGCTVLRLGGRFIDRAPPLLGGKVASRTCNCPRKVLTTGFKTMWRVVLVGAWKRKLPVHRGYAGCACIGRLVSAYCMSYLSLWAGWQQQCAALCAGSATATEFCGAARWDRAPRESRGRPLLGLASRHQPNSTAKATRCSRELWLAIFCLYHTKIKSPPVLQRAEALLYA